MRNARSLKYYNIKPAVGKRNQVNLISPLDAYILAKNHLIDHATELYVRPIYRPIYIQPTAEKFFCKITMRLRLGFYPIDSAA
jgi:hypothetical protein